MIVGDSPAFGRLSANHRKWSAEAVGVPLQAPGANGERAISGNGSDIYIRKREPAHRVMIRIAFMKTGSDPFPSYNHVPIRGEPHAVGFCVAAEECLHASVVPGDHLRREQLADRRIDHARLRGAAGRRTSGHGEKEEDNGKRPNGFHHRDVFLRASMTL